DLERVNAIGAELNEIVHAAASSVLAQKKLPVVLGGDHSVPFGAIQACAELFPGLGILHFDAHADLRDAYEGFTWSHASIMFNVMERIPQVGKLVQVGIRDLGEAEAQYIGANGKRIKTFFDAELQRRAFAGQCWDAAARSIAACLPKNVYL